MLMMQATAKEGVPIDEVEKAIDAEIERIATGGITEEELIRAKTRSEVEFAHQIENYDTRADVIGMMATYFGDATMTVRWLEPYRNATAEEIASTTARRLGADERVTIQFLPEE
jgi:predicted Zn-dependent peptidase